MPSLPFQGAQLRPKQLMPTPGGLPPLLRGEGLVYRTMCFEGQ